MLRTEVIQEWNSLKELIINKRFENSLQVFRLKSGLWSLKDLFDNRIIKLLYGASELETVRSKLKQEEEFVSLLKAKIEQILDSDDDFAGPQIEEFD